MNPRKINEYTYAFDLGEMIYDIEVGHTEDVTENGGKIHKSYIEMYGMENAETFYVYTQDAPLARLPEEFKSWVQWSIDRNSDTLGFTGLYNVNEMYGFYGE